MPTRWACPLTSIHCSTGLPCLLCALSVAATRVSFPEYTRLSLPFPPGSCLPHRRRGDCLLTTHQQRPSLRASPQCSVHLSTDIIHNESWAKFMALCTCCSRLRIGGTPFVTAPHSTDAWSLPGLPQPAPHPLQQGKGKAPKPHFSSILWGLPRLVLTGRNTDHHHRIAMCTDTGRNPSRSCPT